MNIIDISLLNILVMPDYIITVYMKVGEPKTGTRWYSSYDVEHVRFLVEKKVRETIGFFCVERIEVEPADQTDKKPVI
jgi:hypothetical protein